MTELELFQQLKEKILLEYKKHFPYFQGNWKSFSAQDIQNLIILIEENLKQTVSEKWIYTHLKPETNSKLPRKDMLDIFCRFTGVSGWDEFRFTRDESEIPRKKSGGKNVKWIVAVALLIVGLLVVLLIPKTQTIRLKDQFTRENIDSSEVKVYKLDGDEKTPVNIENSSISLTDDQKVVVESPYYKTKEINLKQTNPKTEILIEPNDRAMMLKAFMKSDIKDWETRKVQLETILSDNLEVIVMLRDNLGSEYFNKKEFSEKLIIPTESVRRMKIVDLQSDSQNRIVFIRIKQE